MEKVNKLFDTITTKEASAELLGLINEAKEELKGNEEILASKDKEISDLKELLINNFKSAGSPDKPKEEVEKESTPKSFEECLKEQIEKEKNNV